MDHCVSVNYHACGDRQEFRVTLYRNSGSIGLVVS